MQELSQTNMKYAKNKMASNKCNFFFVFLLVWNAEQKNKKETTLQIRLNDFFFFLIFKCTISNKEEYKIKIPLNFQSYLQFYATNRFNKPIFKFPLSFTDL